MDDRIVPGGPKRPPRRKRIRLPAEIYADPGSVFLITICTADRRPLFAKRPLAEAVFDALLNGRLFGEARCQAACLMPDHLHLLISPNERNLTALLNAWKSYTSNLLHRKGVAGPIWQRSFYDHVLRNEESVHEAASYVVSNPSRTGLVVEWTEYPYVWAYWMEQPRGRPQRGAPTGEA